jgi:carbon storage regulator
MLVLSRHKDERILIGEDISVLVIGVKRGKVRLGVEAPKHIRVDREEVRQRINRASRPGDTP